MESSDGIEGLRQCSLVLHGRFECTAHILARSQVQLTGKSVDQQLLTIEVRQRQIRHPHHGGYAETAGKDGDVGESRAVAGDNPDQPPGLDLTYIQGAQALTHEDVGLAASYWFV